MKRLTAAMVFAALMCAAPMAAHGMNLFDIRYLDAYDTGAHTVDIAGHNFQGHVNHDGTHGWLLVGRGREGWQFDTDGPGGAIAAVSQNLGTTAAFTPTAYTDALINDLITDAGLDLTDVVIRIRRATNTTGSTPYQEARWLPTAQAAWTWDLDTGSAGFAVEYEVDASILSGPFSDATSNTRDTLENHPADNNAKRIFTWSWGGHGGKQGFSYGQTIAGVNNNDPNTFLWENGNENHAIPYAEVYIRTANPFPEPATLTLLALGGLGLLRRRRKR